MNQLQPFNALNELHRELNRVFDGPYNRTPSAYSSTNWTPHVDISETQEEFIVVADIPGVNPEEVEVTLHNSVLTIKGNRDSEITRENESYKRRERMRGTFLRQFSLPELTDEEAIKATANHGVLEISIPKTKKAKPLNIAVKGE